MEPLVPMKVYFCLGSFIGNFFDFVSTQNEGLKIVE